MTEIICERIKTQNRVKRIAGFKYRIFKKDIVSRTPVLASKIKKYVQKRPALTNIQYR